MNINDKCNDKSIKKINVVKNSAGIIIFSNDFQRVILIRKRFTYSYFDFVIGKYNRTNKSYLIKLFNNMTVAEKLIILSLNFEQIWYHIFLTTEKSNDYYKYYTKFYNAFLLNDNIKLLKSLIISSNNNTSLLWEPPKGRKKNKESNVNCAIREVTEETKINQDLYKIIPNYKYKRSIVENGVKYNTIYYVAKYKHRNIISNINLGSTLQVSEIDKIEDINIKHINTIFMYNDIKNFIKFIHKKMKPYKKSLIYE